MFCSSRIDKKIYDYNPVQHLQYIAKLVKDDPLYFRLNFGVQFFLDVILKYFSEDSGESCDVDRSHAATIRWEE